MNGVLAAINPTATLDNAGEGGGENIGRTDSNLVQGLLITEMAKMLVLQRIQNTREHQHQDGGDHKPNYAIVKNHQQNKQGPFCLAWFEPSGIQMTSIVMKGHRDEEDRRTKYPRIVQECCHEWRGYRTPWEVLRPFGYDDNFVSVSFFVGSCYLILSTAWMYKISPVFTSRFALRRLFVCFALPIVTGSVHCHITRSRRKRADLGV